MPACCLQPYTWQRTGCSQAFVGWVCSLTSGSCTPRAGLHYLLQFTANHTYLLCHNGRSHSLVG